MVPRIHIPVIIIAGGESPEHEVSLASSAHLIQVLKPICKYLGVVYVAKDGTWGTQLPIPSHLEPPLPRHTILTLAQRLVGREVPAHQICVLPMIHGTMGEDGRLQGWLEYEGFAYIGSGVLGSAVGMDKAITKRICHQLAIPTLPWVEINQSTWQLNSQVILDQLTTLGPSVDSGHPRWIIKPNTLGSSLGVTAACTQHELSTAIGQAFKWDHTILVEQYLQHKIEIECAVIGKSNQVSLSTPCEVWNSSQIYDYQHKYAAARTPIQPASYLSSAHHTEIHRQVNELFAACRLSGMCRVDWLYSKDDHQLYFNELNTLPGLGVHSHFIELWRQSGKNLTALFTEILFTHPLISEHSV